MAMKNEFKAVVSSNILGIAYDEDTEELQVEFTNGGIYKYSGVPQETYDDFLSAGSPGGFFASEVKGSYPYSRVR